MSCIIAIRHAPIHDAEGLCYGRTDWRLPADATLAQARRLFEAVDPLPLLSSPLQRCSALATQLSQLMARPLRIEPRLIEMDFGRWEACAWRELPRAELDRWRGDIAGYAPPGGERFADLLGRVESALAEVAGEQIWITHAGVIRALKILLQGETLERATRASIPHLTPLRFPLGAPAQPLRR